MWINECKLCYWSYCENETFCLLISKENVEMLYFCDLISGQNNSKVVRKDDLVWRHF